MKKIVLDTDGVILNFGDNYITFAEKILGKKLNCNLNKYPLKDLLQVSDVESEYIWKMFNKLNEWERIPAFHDTEQAIKKINEYKWDAVFIDNELPYDDYLMYLRAVWKVTEGYVFLDRVNSNSQAERAYHDFCRECNRDEMIIKSKYGIGVVEK